MSRTAPNTQGYILLYTVLALSLFAALAVGVLHSTLRELEISEQELEALKARYAAAAGHECVTYWQSGALPHPLDQKGPSQRIRCDTLFNSNIFYDTPDNDPLVDCDPLQTMTFRMGPFVTDNDACADISVEAEPYALLPTECILSVRVAGFSDCSGDPLAERNIWSQL